MNFIETRGNDSRHPKNVSFSEAILNPRASFGGLYVPKSLPDVGISFLSEYIYSDYKTLAFALLKAFKIDIDDDLINEALDRYDSFDTLNMPVEVKKLEDNIFVSELYHGPTRAFKDIALQPFGVILSKLAQKRNEEYLIMAATSGDTGPATLETFKDKDNIKVACLYPANGTSDVQRLQMVTEDASNLKVIGVDGNFDDTQTALKELLNSNDFRTELSRRGLKLSAANSVNFGRIIFQIIYHIYSYLDLIRKGRISLGEEIYLIVPSGNFGNALGAYYAKKAGLPIKKILIASNANNILSDFINSGEYDMRDRKLILTESPAMDILKSSNVERLLFDKFGAERTKELMDDLDSKGYYQLTKSELSKIQEDFGATFCSDQEGEEVIRKYATREENPYLMDPHTATCFKAYDELVKDNTLAVVYSTAEWTKFSPTVAKALNIDAKNDQEALKKISEELNIPIPKVIKSLFEKPVVHSDIVQKNQIQGEMLNFI
jgi:threonine synthase